MKRVVVTGMGAVTPIGKNIDEFWNSIKENRHGFKTITSFDTSRVGISIAATIDDFNPENFGIGKKEARRMDRFNQFALAAARQAVEMSQIQNHMEDPFRIGVIAGSGIGGFQSIEQEHAKYMEKGPSRVSVFFVPMMISNMAAGTIAMEYGFKGANIGMVTACATSTHCIGEAFRAIKHGYLDAAVTGGSEAAITEFSMAGFHNMGALSPSTDPDRASIPFDKERSGFVMGEGAAMLVLEEYEHAVRRGAKIYGEIVGYGATGDAYHMTSPDPEGSGCAKAMELAIAEAGITPKEVDYINAHGTSTTLNDLYETIAIKKAFGSDAQHVAVSSTKSLTGHMLGAAGAVEALACIMALQEGVLPATAGYQVKDEQCDLDYITEGVRPCNARYAISNSLGFGGHNGTIAFKKYN